MRIALIDPSLFSLPYDRGLASGLMQIGHDVTLHGRRLRSGDGSPGSVSVSNSFYHISESRLGGMLPSPLRLGLKGVEHAWSMWRLADRMQREPPDVIHFQWLPLPLIDSKLLGRFKKIAPIVLTVHDTNPFNGEASAAIQRHGIQQCLAQFDRLVVHTRQGEARMRGCGIPPDRIAVLPHGMLADPVASEPDPMDGKLTFLLFGKIRPYKGGDLLIEAFAALPPQLRDQARVRIAGKPYMNVSSLRATAQSAGISVDIEAEFVDDDAIAGLFGTGTVATFPYREIEASGVLFLALAYGRPIIASRLGLFAELLTDGEHGLLVPANDVTALTAAMQRMLTDRRFAASCGAAVQTLAGSIPGWDEIARRTVATYREICVPARRGSEAPVLGLP
jgi:glycosyltransferase involved in cell wall biosynthesis